MSMASSAIGMAICDPDGRFMYANPALEHMLDYGAGQLTGMAYSDLTYPDDLAVSDEGRELMIAGENESLLQRKRYLTRTGGVVWIDLAASAVRNPAGEVDHFLSQMIDVTAEVEATESLQRSVRRFRMLAENASDVVYQTDVNGVIEWVSPSVSDVLGWDPELLVGTKATSLVAPEDLVRVTTSRTQIFRGVREHGVLAQFLTVRGGRQWMSVTAKPLLGVDDDVVGAVVGLRDVTSEQLAHQELALTQERFRLAMDVAPQGMVLTDAAGLVVDVNPAAAGLLGVEQAEMLGSSLSEVLSAQAGECSSDERHEHVRQTSEGQLWIDHVTSRLQDEDGRSVYLVHQFIDETSDRMWLRELEHEASHDVLTGVANRRSLLTHLDRMIVINRTSGRAKDRLGLLFCDVDGLKLINDTFGHHVGDAVLARVADRVGRALRRGDRVGRIGGDEFVVVLDGVESRDELGVVAEKIRLAAGRPIDLDGQVVTATVSIGAVLVASDENADSALARADAALYQAKEAGRDRVVVAQGLSEDSPTEA